MYFILRFIFVIWVLLFSCSPQNNLTNVAESNEESTNPQSPKKYADDGDDFEFISSKWSVKVYKISEENLTNIIFVGSKTGWITTIKGEIPVDYKKYKIEHSSLLKTTDGGNTWKQANVILPENSFIKEIFFLDELKGWLIIQGAGSDPERLPFWVMETNNGGESWEISYKFTAQEVSKLIFNQTGEGWLIGAVRPLESITQGMVLHSNNFGKTWTEVYSDDLFTTKSGKRIVKKMWSPIKDIKLTQSGYPIMVLQNGMVFFMKGSAQKWEQIIFQETKQFGSNHLVIGEKDEFLLFNSRKTDNGKLLTNSLWTNNSGDINEVRKENFYLTDVISTNNSEILACGYISLDDNNDLAPKLGRNPVIFFTSNKGQSWETVYETKGFLQSMDKEDANKNPIPRTKFGKYFNNYSVSFNKISKNSEDKFFIVGDNGLFLTIFRKD